MVEADLSALQNDVLVRHFLLKNYLGDDMKKGQEYVGVVERVDFPNKGIVSVDGEEKKAIVKDAIEGQRIRFAVNKTHKDKCEGRLLEVLERSPLETAKPLCPHFGICGGCTCQTLPYEEQLKLKASQVRRLLDSVCKDYEFEGIKGSPVQWEYRNKMEFSFGDEYKDGPLALGMHKKGSFYDIVTVNGCRLADEDYRKLLSCVLLHMSERSIPYYHKMRHTGCLRHLLVRKAVKTGEILLALVTTSQYASGRCASGQYAASQYATDGIVGIAGGDACPQSGAACAEEDAACPQGEAVGAEGGAMCQQSEAACTEEGAACHLREIVCAEDYLGLAELTSKLLELKLSGSITGILHVENDSPADVVQSDKTTLLYGKDYFYEELLGLRFKISPFSFFQTNSLGAEVLYETARSFVGETKDKLIFDLYSGTGTIAQMLAPVAKKVVGVEIVEEAVEAAKLNARLNGLDNCEFIAGDVLKVLDTIPDKPDLIVLDPPRDGIHPKALQKIAASLRATKIIYISCKPTSLARDLVALQEYGYEVRRACCVDMFPGTYHVETVCELVLKED